jgi:hypothetical protein
MSDQNNNSTDQLPAPTLEERVASLEKLVGQLLTDIRSGFNRMDTRFDELAKTQREMYVDLRERIDLLSDKVNVMQRSVDQVVRDARPDSLQNRLLN